MPEWKRVAAAVVLAAALAVPTIVVAQAAQAVRVPRDSGLPGGSVSGGLTEHRYGPPETVRKRDARMEQSVPAQFAPPAGMCRVWVGGVPPDQQPAPTECAKAVRVRSPNSRVVFGRAKPSPQVGLSTNPSAGWATVAGNGASTSGGGGGGGGGGVAGGIANAHPGGAPDAPGASGAAGGAGTGAHGSVSGHGVSGGTAISPNTSPVLRTPPPPVVTAQPSAHLGVTPPAPPPSGARSSAHPPPPPPPPPKPPPHVSTRPRN